MKRIVHVVRQYTPSVGGMEEVVRNLAAHQCAQGRYDASIVTLNKVFRTPAQTLPSEEVVEGVRVRRIAYRGSERYPLAPSVLAEVEGADLIHVHGIDFFFDFLAMTRAWHRTPLVASTHGGFFHTRFARQLKKAYFNSITRLSAAGYARVLATSENDGELFGRIMDGGRLKVIENGADVEKFRDASAAAPAPVIIYFGRWSINKGLRETFALFAHLSAAQPTVPWQLIVAGREYDLGEQDLRTLAQNHGIAERVTIVSSPDKASLRALISRASFFMCLSHHEGFGIAAVEAMSAGLVPLLSDIPPFRRLVEHTGCGLVLEDDPDLASAQLLQATGRVLAGDTQREACMRAAEQYSWVRVGEAYAQEYEQVLQERDRA